MDKSESALVEESFNCIRPMRKGLIYYSLQDDQIVHVYSKVVYFAPDKFWKLKTYASGKMRSVKDLTEIKELMNKSDYQFIGEL